VNTIKIDAKQTRMIAHRGVCGLERENTYPAFVAAGNRSYFGIETDVHTTADGKFVIIHDETTDRVSGGAHSINVEESPLSALSEITLPDLDGRGARGDIRIPSLAEYVRICKKYEKVCVLEVKNRFSETDLRAMIAEIESLDYLEGMIFISFSWENCTDLRRLLPDAHIQWLTDHEVTDEMIAELVENKLDLDIYFERLDAATIARLHKAGIAVNCWTVDNAKVGQALADAGVDFITTDILEGK
jgi:glycerophosphoryl diester phosphodiesterase